VCYIGFINAIKELTNPLKRGWSYSK